MAASEPTDPKVRNGVLPLDEPEHGGIRHGEAAAAGVAAIDGAIDDKLERLLAF